MGASSKICYLDSSPLKELTLKNVNVTKFEEEIGAQCFDKRSCAFNLKMDEVIYSNNTWLKNRPPPAQFFFA